MSGKVAMVTLFLTLTLLWVGSARAQASPQLTVFFYRDGQVVSAARPGTLSGDPQADAVLLLAA
ncbi:MAG: hypothetical protein PVF77_02730, partial [Anaerolineae bacterium]